MDSYICIFIPLIVSKSNTVCDISFKVIAYYVNNDNCSLIFKINKISLSLRLRNNTRLIRSSKIIIRLRLKFDIDVENG